MPWIRSKRVAVLASRGLARAMLSLVAAIALGRLPVAEAQVLRTPLPLPTLPKLDLPLGTDAVLRDPLQALSPQRLEDLRLLRLRKLLRAHGDVLESDPHGAPIVKRQILAWSLSGDGLARARAREFTTGERTALGEAGELIVLVPRAGLGTRAALKELRRLDPAGTYEFNHLFLESGAATPPAPLPPGGASAATPVALPATARRAGLIDGGIEASHPAFAATPLHHWGCSGRLVPSSHGTAVASLLAGRASDFRGAAPGAELYAADVFCGGPTGGSADAIVAAMAWLLQEHVPVINVSLVGPPNAVLERVVERVLARGTLIVAAVGNDGPAAPPAYPASYPGVVAVTAVDANGRLLLEAGRALHVDVAAPGADMLAAAPPGSYSPVRGTSFAAPLVSGLLALELDAPDPSAASTALRHIEESAVVPAGNGPAAHYGKGVVGGDLRVPAPAGAEGRKASPRSF